jgi:hypothetical protein
MIAFAAIIAKREREARRLEAQARDDHRLDSFFPSPPLMGGKVIYKRNFPDGFMLMLPPRNPTQGILASWAQPTCGQCGADVRQQTNGMGIIEILPCDKCHPDRKERDNGQADD